MLFCFQAPARIRIKTEGAMRRRGGRGQDQETEAWGQASDPAIVYRPVHIWHYNLSRLIADYRK